MMENKIITTPANETRKAVKKQFAIMKHKKQLLTILSLLFICVIGWAVVSLFAAQQKTKIDSKFLKYATPLTANLDLETLNALESKRSFTESELTNFPIFRVYTDPKTREEKVISIDAPLPTPTPRATPRPTTAPNPATP